MKSWKILPLLLCGFLAAVSVKAQEVIMGPYLVIPQAQKASIGAAYFEDDNSMVVLSQPKYATDNRYQLMLVDSNFKEVWVTPLGVFSKYQNVEDLVVIGQQIYLFMREYDPSKDELAVFFERFDRKTGQSLAPKQELIRAYKETKDRQMFVYNKLDDGRLLCYGRFADRRLEYFDRRLTIEYRLFKPDVPTPQVGGLSLPFHPNDYEMVDFNVSPKGDFFLLGCAENERKKYSSVMRGLTEKRTYILLRHSPEAQKTDTILVDHGDLRMEQVYCAVTSLNRLVITGFSKFNPLNTRSDMAELFYYNADASALPERIVLNRIGLKNPNEVTGGDILRGSEADFGDIYVKPDGSVFLTAQKIREPRTTSSMMTGGGFPMMMPTAGPGIGFMAGGIWITVSVQPAFWQGRQQRTRRSLSDYFEAYLIHLGPDTSNHSVVEVPIKQNLNGYQDKSFFSFEQGKAFNFVYRQLTGKDFTSLYLRRVDENGTVGEPRLLLKGFTANEEFLPDQCKQVGPNDAILMYYRVSDRAYVIARLSVIPK